MKKNPPWFDAMMTRVAVQYPFYATILLGTPCHIIEPDEPIAEVITTAATDGSKIMFNREFMEAIDTAANGKGHIFVVAHEIMHIVTMTISRLGSRDPALWNVASDYAINGMLEGAKLLTKGSLPMNAKWKGFSEFKVFVDRNRWPNSTAEQIYDDLVESDDKQSKKFDHHLKRSEKFVKDASGDWTIGPRSAEETEMETRRIKAKVIQAYASEKAAGRDASGIERFVKELSEPKVDWKTYIARLICGMGGSEDYVWERPDSAFFGSGITLPTIFQDPRPRLVIVTDSSGSIQDSDLRNVLSEVCGLISQFQSWDIHILAFDSQIHNPRTYSSEDGQSILTYPFVGGGGTVFENPIKYLAKEIAHEGRIMDFDPDMVLFFTDGYGEGWFSSYEEKLPPVLWLMNTDVVPPWGWSVRYDRYA